MDTISFIGSSLWITYKTMVVIYFMYWIFKCYTMHTTDVLSLYDDKNINVRWVKYIVECITGSFITSLLWPWTAYRFAEQSLNDALKLD